MPAPVGYLPSVSALWYPVKMWFRVHWVAPRCLQDGLIPCSISVDYLRLLRGLLFKNHFASAVSVALLPWVQIPAWKPTLSSLHLIVCGLPPEGLYVLTLMFWQKSLEPWGIERQTQILFNWAVWNMTHSSHIAMTGHREQAISRITQWTEHSILTCACCCLEVQQTAVWQLHGSSHLLQNGRQTLFLMFICHTRSVFWHH